MMKIGCQICYRIIALLWHKSNLKCYSNWYTYFLMKEVTFFRLSVHLEGYMCLINFRCFSKIMRGSHENWVVRFVTELLLYYATRVN